ncbi:hypothetical protein [Streptomyces sp. B6B3]|uniref:hypothetical protein n=1 Tax=Streptomyces sp. B6B3 TaxID=3153570 RepID=UPI00325D73CD
MRSAKTLAYLFGGLVAAGAASYLVIYLYRWQWQRAILSGVLLLVVEVLLLGLAILDRISRLERRVRDDDRHGGASQAAKAWGRQEEWAEPLARLPDRPSAGPSAGPSEVGAAPPAAAGERPGTEEDAARARARFAWLDQTLDRERHTFVFVPVLMAAGVAMSGLAWVVERIARRMVRPIAGAGLAARLAPLAAPPGGVGGVPELPDRPAVGPGPGGRRRWLRVAGWAAVVAVCCGLVVGLAQLTRTEPPERGADAATTVLFSVDSRGLPEERGALAAQQQWERCRDATSVPLDHAGMTALDDGIYAATIYPSLSEHDQTRLLGCLEDAAIDRVQLHVIGTTAVASVERG